MSGTWTIQDENNMIIGLIELRFVDEDTSAFNIFLTQKYNRKRGLGTDVSRELFRYITDQKWTTKITSTINVNNRASNIIIQRLFVVSILKKRFRQVGTKPYSVKKKHFKTQSRVPPD